MTEAAPDYAAFAAGLRATHLLSDPWFDGAPRFRAEPIVLKPAEARALVEAAEAFTEAHQNLVEIVAADGGLLDRYFDLTPCQKLMFLASAPSWHGVARADAFFTADGVRICELNSDTPSGEAEAIVLGRLAKAGRPDAADPAAEFEARFIALVRDEAAALGVRGAPSVGVVYPTEMPEDLSMIRLYRDLLLAAGMRVVLGSPFNLDRGADGSLRLFGEPIDVLLRHYKTDWWGERESAWDDEPPPPDAEPLAGPLADALAAAAEGRVAVVNPFGAVLTQNKRSLAFLWEERARLPKRLRAAIERVLPPTFRLESCDRATLGRERDEWVLKSDYGCEGAEVVVGSECDEATWAATLLHARPKRWIAQRRFEPLRDAAGEAANFGVYVIAGRAAGFFARVQAGPTDPAARCAPVLIAEDAR